MAMNPMIVTDPENCVEYTLEFSRKTVAKTEAAGFDANRMDSSPMTMLPLLFWGAFLMHHPYIKQDETNRILFDGLNGLSSEEAEYLGKLYAEPFKALIAEPEEGVTNPRKMGVKF